MARNSEVTPPKAHSLQFKGRFTNQFFHAKAKASFGRFFLTSPHSSPKRPSIKIDFLKETKQNLRPNNFQFAEADVRLVFSIMLEQNDNKAGQIYGRFLVKHCLCVLIHVHVAFSFFIGHLGFQRLRKQLNFKNLFCQRSIFLLIFQNVHLQPSPPPPPQGFVQDVSFVTNKH